RRRPPPRRPPAAALFPYPTLFRSKGAPRVQQYSADFQRELPGGMTVSVGYTGLTGKNLSWGGSLNATININQLDPKYQSLGATEDRKSTRLNSSHDQSSYAVFCLK